MALRMKPSPSRHELAELIRKSIAIVAAMSPEEREAMRKAQRESWVRGEMGLAEAARGKKHVMPDGSIHYDDYEAYCCD